MKIAMCQLDVKAGRPELNVKNMLDMIEIAKEKKAEIVIFPEMAVGGYFVGDLWLEDSWCEYLMEYNEILKKASSKITIIYGNIFIDKEKKNNDGRIRKYNAVYIFQNGKPAINKLNKKLKIPEGIAIKSLLPNYRIFDDRRYFYPYIDLIREMGHKIDDFYTPFSIKYQQKEIHIGLTICEDMWFEDYTRCDNEFKKKKYNPIKSLILNGSDLIINISASPWTFGKEQARNNRILNLKKNFETNLVPIYYVNACGVQNNGKNFITFDGGSTIYNQEGNQIFPYRAEDYQEQIIIANHEEIIKDIKQYKEKRKPKIKQKYDAIIRAIQALDEILDWIPNYVIGLSGGVDSSLVATLVAHAVGPERIYAYNLPTKYNSTKTRNSASALAKNLKITHFSEISISQFVQTNMDLLRKSGKLSSLVEENIQAKIRGTSILSNFAGIHNGIMTNNGNKLEIALGYVTLYGDVNGAIAPIGDLTKTEVFQMAEYINKNYGEIIPSELIPDENFNFSSECIPPSAELKENQLDPMKFGYHDALLESFTNYQKKTPEDILKWYIEGKLADKLKISETLLNKYGINNPHTFIEDLKWFTITIRRAIFKRIQGPPIVLLSKSAYGFDIRESQFKFTETFKYKELKKKILDKY